MVLRRLLALATEVLAPGVVVTACTSAVVELASLAGALITRALITTTGTVAVLALTAHSLHAVLAILAAEHVAEEVLLHFLEAALLTFLMKFLSGHPELNGKRASAEGS